MYNNYDIELNNVSKIVRHNVLSQKTIIDQVSLKIRKNEVFGLLGPDGAGKTTLIKMMVGLTSITSGEVLICHENISFNFEKAIEKIGAIVENVSLYENLTGFQNLKVFGRMYMDVSDDYILSLVDMLKLSDRINDKVKIYSLGMKQRLGIAVALLNKPQILILDEPTNGLDPQGVIDLRNCVHVINLFQKLTMEFNLLINSKYWYNYATEIEFYI